MRFKQLYTAQGRFQDNFSIGEGEFTCSTGVSSIQNQFRVDGGSEFQGWAAGETLAAELVIEVRLVVTKSVGLGRGPVETSLRWFRFVGWHRGGGPP